jgi:hypothetical protein
MRLRSRPTPLRGLRVGISGAVPEREAWGDVQDLDQIILRFVAQLSRLVIKYGGSLVHGSHPTFTPVMAAQVQPDEWIDAPSLTLIASLLFGDPPTVVERAHRVARVVLTNQIGEGGADNRQTLADSLTALRMQLIREVDVIVAVGGKLHIEDGYHRGVLEELTLARWQDIPCFIVGSAGGLAGRAHDDVARQFSTGNRLGEQDVRRLAERGVGLDAAVGLLLEHLVVNAHLFRRERDQLGAAFSRDPAIDGFELLSADGTFSPLSERVRFEAGAVRAVADRFAEVRAAFDQGDAGRVAALIGREYDRGAAT